jgi:uncharacterized protein YggE
MRIRQLCVSRAVAGHIAARSRGLSSMPRLLLSFFAVFAVAACQDRVVAIAPPTVADTPSTMSVTGAAVLEVSPDCADLTMTLSVDDVRPSKASSQVNQRRARLVAAFAERGVAPADIKLSQVTLGPVYSPEVGPPRLIGYRAAITLTATTHDFSAIGVLMDAASDAGATEISSQFRRSDLPELKKKVRDMAFAAAKDKAHQIASNVGFELGRVVAVSENPGGAMWSSRYFPQVANAVQVEQAPAPAATIGGAGQSISLDVSITYQLGRKA